MMRQVTFLIVVFSRMVSSWLSSSTEVSYRLSLRRQQILLMVVFAECPERTFGQ